VKKFILVLLVLATALALVSCSGGGREKIKKVYKGEGEFDKTTVQDVKIEDLINEPDKYSPSFVSVEGQIVTECSVGCWFFIKSDKGNQMYVDLSAQNFAIPQAVKHKVRVTGIFENRASNPRITAYEVEFLDVSD
jgi:uncharacterized protein YdeI (BOF family)